MSITLTANYTETPSAEVVEKIEELRPDYHLDDMLEFIDEKSEFAFPNHYEDYVEAGEDIGYKAVDAFVEYHGIECVEHCVDAYYGAFDSKEEFTEEYYDGRHDIPSDIIIDWEATLERNLRFDYDFIDGYVFNRNF